MNNSYKVQPLEKIISILSYFSMGIVGLIWLIIAFVTKKHLKFFLKYNIVQSLVISIFLAIFKLILDIILSVLALIPFLTGAIATINWFISIKVISIFYFSFSIFELLIYILLIYITIGIFIGKIFYVPILSHIINKTMKRYE
ncbi:MAG: hypothetical protein IJY61_05035 [Candidatus Gastranaerophilales bacterium]|nr:hypothetical protein [Candidatus Gastranaerophilales bacterium]